MRPDADPAVKWLLSSADPSVRYLTLTEVCGISPDSPPAAQARRALGRGPRVRALLAGQRGDGGFGGHPYTKWTGAHWRLVSLVELGIPPGHRAAVRAYRTVLDWLLGAAHRRSIVRIRGRVRRCASQEGNALRVGVRLGLGDHPGVRQLARDLASWQWPDGGWNCDRRPDASHSSLHESLIPLWGLVEYRAATGDRGVDEAVERASEFFLIHRLCRSHRTGAVISSGFLRLRYPPYWHYDVLTALRVLAAAGRIGDPRVREALDYVQSRRGADGLWRADGRWWRPAGRRGRGPADVADWGARGPNEMITLNALAVLTAAGRR
jgi:hypothetical protein